MSSGLERDTKGWKVAMGRGPRELCQLDRNAGAVGCLVRYLSGTQ